MNESVSPYDHLYIYYLSGRLKRETDIQHPHFIGEWQEDQTSFLFFSQPALDEVKHILEAEPQLTLIDKYHMEYDQWHGDKIQPYRVGRFFITPAWKNQPSESENITIAIDPGVVFGTGTHPTTRDCLEAIDLLAREFPIDSVLELGTGTGVLALAASQAGSKITLAVDVNYLAAKTAVHNVRLNGLESQVFVIQGNATDWVDWPAELLIANIHFDVMRQLVDRVGFTHAKWFILSGLLRSQAAEIRNVLFKKPVKLLKEWRSEGIWHTFLGKFI